MAPELTSTTTIGPPYVCTVCGTHWETATIRNCPHVGTLVPKSPAYVEAQEEIALMIAHFRHRDDRSAAFMAVEILDLLAEAGWRQP